jgi:4-cresol dehydrogenase (hydroxylating)
VKSESPATATTDAVAQAMDQFAKAIGSEAVVTAAESLDEFRDPFAYIGSTDHLASGMVMPATVEEVQAVVRVAGRYGVPLWPFSQGRNYAYGGPAPRVAGSVLVNLRRMNRVIEVNDECAYALVEPGVRFYDMYEHLRANGHKLWSSAPDLGWGSVIGNALEHGVGYTAHGDHAGRQCGMEVVLASGELLRTGMGAMTGNPAWQAYPRGFGPTPDGLFKQSNYGIVTKMGIWLMPEPECYMSCGVQVQREEDLVALIDAVRPLLLDGTIQNQPAIGNAVFVASVMDGVPSRQHFYDGPGPIPEPVIMQIAREVGIGRWNMRFALYGDEDMVDARFARVRAALSAIPGLQTYGETFAGSAVHDQATDQTTRVQAGIPSQDLLRALAWYSGPNGGHLDFSLISPLRGSDVARQNALVHDLLQGSGVDYDPAMILGQRHAINVNQLYFDTHDERRTRAAYELYPRLVMASAQAGFGLYRTHLAFMDVVAEQFDFSNHAQRRFNEKIKDALDPKGILAPGKQGIWPTSMRTQSQHVSDALVLIPSHE